MKNVINLLLFSFVLVSTPVLANNTFSLDDLKAELDMEKSSVSSFNFLGDFEEDSSYPDSSLQMNNDGDFYVGEKQLADLNIEVAVLESDFEDEVGPSREIASIINEEGDTKETIKPASVENKPEQFVAGPTPVGASNFSTSQASYVDVLPAQKTRSNTSGRSGKKHTAESNTSQAVSVASPTDGILPETASTVAKEIIAAKFDSDPQQSINISEENSVEPTSVEPTPTPFAGPVMVDSKTGTSQSSSIVSTDLSVVAEEGQLYVAMISVNDGSHQVSDVTGLGLTWTYLSKQCANSSDDNSLEVWYAIGTPTVDSVVTAFFNGEADSAQLAVMRFSGVNEADPIQEAFNANSNGTGVDAICGGPANAEEYTIFNFDVEFDNVVLLGAISFFGNNEFTSNSFSELHEIESGVGVGRNSLSVQQLNISTAGTYTVDGYLNVPTMWTSLGVLIKP